MRGARSAGLKMAALNKNGARGPRPQTKWRPRGRAGERRLVPRRLVPPPAAQRPIGALLTSRGRSRPDAPKPSAAERARAASPKVRLSRGREKGSSGLAAFRARLCRSAARVHGLSGAHGPRLYPGAEGRAASGGSGGRAAPAHRCGDRCGVQCGRLRCAQARASPRTHQRAERHPATQGAAAAPRGCEGRARGAHVGTGRAGARGGVAQREWGRGLKGRGRGLTRRGRGPGCTGPCGE